MAAQNESSPGSDRALDTGLTVDEEGLSLDQHIPGLLRCGYCRARPLFLLQTELPYSQEKEATSLGLRSVIPYTTSKTKQVAGTISHMGTLR